jgi:PAS domain-containing protein
MPPLVPEPSPGREGDAALGLSLEGLLEFIGASSGWVGLKAADGRLTVPVRRGDFPDAWLALQQGRAGPWGFAVREGPTLLNDLGPLPGFGGPSPHSLLTCPLAERGHLVLADKPTGFSSYDAAIVQAAAHLMVRQLPSRDPRPAAAWSPPPLWGGVLDRVAEGVFVIGDDGGLIYANAVWREWTGFTADELTGAVAPFPFWVSDRDLQTAASRAAGAEGGLPFRRRDGAVFWRRVRTIDEDFEDRRFTLAYLTRPSTEDEPPSPPAQRAAEVDWLPLLLRPGGEVAWWDASWEELTGLTAAELRATPCETVMDWIMPRQRDRDLAADWMNRPPRSGGQGVVWLTTRGGERPFVCTLLPVPPAENGVPRWLLLAAPAPENASPRIPTAPADPSAVAADA